MAATAFVCTCSLPPFVLPPVDDGLFHCLPSPRCRWSRHEVRWSPAPDQRACGCRTGLLGQRGRTPSRACASARRALLLACLRRVRPFARTRPPLPHPSVSIGGPPTITIVALCSVP